MIEKGQLNGSSFEGFAAILILIVIYKWGGPKFMWLAQLFSRMRNDKELIINMMDGDE